jgi:phage gp36-like protein
MFIEVDDYRVVIGEPALKVVAQANPENCANAEAEAVEEISGFLRPKYDCARIFAAEGPARNRQLLMYACDIALYHMASSLPNQMGMAIRKERYEKALEWLRKVQDGTVLPDLPLALDEQGNSAAPSIRYGSQPCVDNSY